MASTEESTESPEVAQVAKQYYNALSLESQEKYEEAFLELTRIVALGGNHEYLAKAEFEKAKCLFSLNQYDKCIKDFTHFIQTYPKYPDLADALYVVGLCHQKKDDLPKATALFKKVVSMAPQDQTVHRQAAKALRGIEGGTA